MPKQKIIAIVGPTSSGKTALGIWLAKKLNSEIISADSRQVYKSLDIGTGKVTKKEMMSVPHHLLDVANPRRQFSADDFVRLGTKAITSIYRRGHIPVVVGGTGFYVDALLGRLTFPNVAPNSLLRKQLEKKSASELLSMLKKLDPARAATIEPKHKRRLIRAIEIAKAVGARPKAERRVLEGEAAGRAPEVLWLGLKPSPDTLKKNIRIRLLARIRSGMIAEAQKLHRNGLSYKRMEELGLEYHFLSYLLQKKITRKTFEAQLERAINHYAKRQMRWFARNKNIHWIQNKSDALRLAQKFLGGPYGMK